MTTELCSCKQDQLDNSSAVFLRAFENHRKTRRSSQQLEVKIFCGTSVAINRMLIKDISKRAIFLFRYSIVHSSPSPCASLLQLSCSLLLQVQVPLSPTSVPLSITKSNGETSAGHIVMLFKGDKTSLLQQIKDAGGQITSD